MLYDKTQRDISISFNLIMSFSPFKTELHNEIILTEVCC